MSVSDTITGASVYMGNKTGPASYAAGGFELDLTASLSTIGFLQLVVETVGVLPPCHLQYTLNKDSTGANAPGKAVIKVMRDRYDKMSVGNVSGNPASTTVQAAKTATGTTTGSSHTHAIDHDHPSATSATYTAAGGAVASGAGNMKPHVHTVDLPNFTGTSGASTHTHDRSFEYEHDHPVTAAETNSASTEITAGTNLSGVTWRYFAAGF